MPILILEMKIVYEWAYLETMITFSLMQKISQRKLNLKTNV